MTVNELKTYIASDLYRHGGACGLKLLLKNYLLSRSFKITFWYRIAKFCRVRELRLLGFFVRLNYRRICTHYCVDLPVQTEIGKGLIIYHCFGLVVNSDSIIGDNVMLAQQVTLATEKGHAPVIENRVRIAPGVKIVGGVHVGSGSVIGANSVVVHDVPKNRVSVGIPNKVLDKPFSEFVERYYWPKNAGQRIS